MVRGSKNVAYFPFLNHLGTAPVALLDVAFDGRKLDGTTGLLMLWLLPDGPASSEYVSILPVARTRAAPVPVDNFS